MFTSNRDISSSSAQQPFKSCTTAQRDFNNPPLNTDWRRCGSPSRVSVPCHCPSMVRTFQSTFQSGRVLVPFAMYRSQSEIRRPWYQTTPWLAIDYARRSPQLGRPLPIFRCGRNQNIIVIRIEIPIQFNGNNCAERTRCENLPHRDWNKRTTMCLWLNRADLQ